MPIVQFTVNCEITINNEHGQQHANVEVKIYSEEQENFNTSLMETLCQNQELFRNLREFDQIKTIFDCMLQHTVEKVNAEPSGKYVWMDKNQEPLNKREVYILSQNNNGQNILHLAINVFKYYPNRMAIIFTLVEVLKSYLTYPSWYYLCFVQRNSKDIKDIGLDRDIFYPSIEVIRQNGLGQKGYSAFQNLYYMRYPMIIGAFDNEHKRYSTGQTCVEALSVWNRWTPQGSIEEFQNENIYLKKLQVAQYALQQICRNQTYPPNNYLITIWRDSHQTFFDSLLGKSQTPVFYFCGELEPLNKVLDDILNTLFETNSDLMYVIGTGYISLTNYAFDKGKTAKIICDVVQKCGYQIPETLNPNRRQINVMKEESSEDPEVKELCQRVEEAENAKKLAQLQAGHPQSNITQISAIPEDERLIKSFADKSVSEILKMFDQNCYQLMEAPSERDPSLMINIPEFLIWMSGPCSKLSWSDMVKIFEDEGVVFSIRLWMQEVVDNVKWRIYIPRTLRAQQECKYYEVNVFGFLVYIGVPLVLLTKVLSVKSTGVDLGELLCNARYSKHFELLDRSRFLLHKGDSNSASIAFIMLLVMKERRNIWIDRLNVEFLLYFVNTQNNEFSLNRRQNICDYEQMVTKKYIDGLNHSQVIQEHFNKGCQLTFENINQDRLRETINKCQAYVDEQNRINANMFIRMGIPEQRFIKQALLDEQVLEILKQNIEIRFNADEQIHMNVIFVIKHENINGDNVRQ